MNNLPGINGIEKFDLANIFSFLEAMEDGSAQQVVRINISQMHVLEKINEIIDEVNRLSSIVNNNGCIMDVIRGRK